MKDIYNWVSMLGDFEQEKDKIVFRGGLGSEPITGKNFPYIGNYVCNRKFGGGEIEVTINFPEITEDAIACGLMFCYDSDQRYFVTATIEVRKETETAFVLKHFDKKWTIHDAVGQKTTIKPRKDYRLKVIVEGSRVEFLVNDVSVIKKDLPFPLPRKQVGIWCQGSKNIEIRNFRLNETEAKAFVIMQFSAPYNELFRDVIEPVCKEKTIKALRADEKYGPGHILSDIMQEIFLAKFIIAEITPPNQNVFFEVGFAHAMRKPIIFIAERGKELPFDVSGFRVLFYENSIAGKNEIEEGLKKNIDAILAGPFV